MIFRLTSKLSKKIGSASLPALPFDKNNPLMDWSAHLFTAQRIQYIILTNTASLYSMIMPGRGVADDRQFVRGVLTCMKAFMTIDSNKVIFEKGIEPESHDVFFSKITDRRVAGSMNDFIFQAKVRLIEGQRSLFDVSLLLNESPMSYLGYNRPTDEFRKLFFKDAESSAKGQGRDNVIYINVNRPPTTKF
jgi:hypothetical protein